MLCDGIQVLSSALSVESQIPVCFYSTETVVVFVCVYRIIQFPRPVKFKEVVQKVTDAFGQMMDLVCVNNEVLFSLLLRGSFRVPGANFRIEQWFVLKALILRFTWMQKKITLFCGSQVVRAPELLSGHSSDGFSDSKPGFPFSKSFQVRPVAQEHCLFPRTKDPPRSVGAVKSSHLGGSRGSVKCSAAHTVFFHPALTLSHPNPSTMCTFLWPGLQ